MIALRSTPRTIINTKSSARSMCVSPDGQFIFTGLADGSICEWFLSTRECIRVFNGHSFAVSSVSISNDGKYIFSGSWDKTIRQWMVSTGQCVQVFSTTNGHTDGVNSVCMSSDSLYLYSASADSTIRRWEISTGQCVAVFPHPHGVQVLSLCRSSNDEFIFSGSYGKDTIPECLRWECWIV